MKVRKACLQLLNQFNRINLMVESDQSDMELDHAEVYQQWNIQVLKRMLELLVNIAPMNRECLIRSYK